MGPESARTRVHRSRATPAKEEGNEPIEEPAPQQRERDEVLDAAAAAADPLPTKPALMHTKQLVCGALQEIRAASAIDRQPLADQKLLMLGAQVVHHAVEVPAEPAFVGQA